MLLFYPLDQVSWELEGRKLNSDLRRKVFPANGTLVIKKVKNQRIRGLLQRLCALCLLCNKQLFLKFIYSEKATKFCEIFTLLLTVCTVVKSKVKISQNFVAFSEYMNFTYANSPWYHSYIT